MKTHKRSNEWFEDDAFWRETFPFIFAEKRLAHADEMIGKVLKLAPVQGKAALDLCCGPGRFSIALAERGFSVTGVDRTKYLLQKARLRARAAKISVEWVQKDMRNFVRPGAYDFVLSMFRRLDILIFAKKMQSCSGMSSNRCDRAGHFS